MCVCVLRCACPNAHVCVLVTALAAHAHKHGTSLVAGLCACMQVSMQRVCILLHVSKVRPAK